MAVHVGSSSEWKTILQSTIVVVDCTINPALTSQLEEIYTDYYTPIVHADWCGPCKMIAPTFESLATKYSKPKRITFAKVNVDNQREIASQYGVSAMPTFIILKNGSPIETIRGANPPSLIAAVEKAVKLAGPSVSSGFSAPGRTLGNPSPGQSLQRPLKWDLNNFVNVIIGFIGLYFVSLFTVSNFDNL